MDIREIEQLVRLLERSQISSLEVEEGDKRIKLKKQQCTPLVNPGDLSVTAQEGPFSETGAVHLDDPQLAGFTGQNAGSVIPGASAVPADAAAANTAAAAPRGKEVKSPMVGVFYGAPSPDEEPFVKVGSQVKKGDVLCIIEAMKLMNEIAAETDGEIAEICVENGDVVEFGQPLFRIV